MQRVIVQDGKKAGPWYQIDKDLKLHFYKEAEIAELWTDKWDK